MLLYLFDPYVTFIFSLDFKSDSLQLLTTILEFFLLLVDKFLWLSLFKFFKLSISIYRLSETPGLGKFSFLSKKFLELRLCM